MFDDKFVNVNIVCFDVTYFSFIVYVPIAHMGKAAFKTPLLLLLLLIQLMLIYHNH